MRERDEIPLDEKQNRKILLYSSSYSATSLWHPDLKDMTEDEGSCVNALDVGVCVRQISILILNTLIVQCRPLKMLYTKETGILIWSVVDDKWTVHSWYDLWCLANQNLHLMLNTFLSLPFQQHNWRILKCQLTLKYKSEHLQSSHFMLIWLVKKSYLLWSLRNDLTICRNSL